MNRPHSGYHNRIYITSRPQEKNRLNILGQSQPNAKFINYFDNLDKELDQLQNSWDNLGITRDYRISFLNHLDKLSLSGKKDFYNYEKNNLKRFREALLNLKNEIWNREENLSKLKKLNKDLEKCVNDGNNANSKKNILQQVINCIKNLRLNAINIVKKVIKVNEISAYYSNSGRWDVKKINPDYSYDPNYLFKMKKYSNFFKKFNNKLFYRYEQFRDRSIFNKLCPIPQ